MGKHFSVTDFPHLMVDNNVTPHPLEDYIISHPMPISVKAQNGESFIELSVKRPKDDTNSAKP